ncbi:ABC transporter permease [Clostridium culturomicium]|uniref:ABC transporter permease n=1 Tax=Clostridium culturomicium TaxID=1499683 RepID=UPI00058B3B8F|nr:ABC transporter permease [Clostridium culturomicium]
MKKYIFKRVIQIIPVILLVSILSFLIIHSAPGDPINMYIKPDMTQYEIEELREEMGLNGSVISQYALWLGNIVKGDWGYSLINNRPVLDLILAKLPSTILLMASSLMISFLISIPLGLISGFHENKSIDRVISFCSYIGVSIPTFWFAILLIVIFTLQLGWLPSVGMRTTGVSTFTDLIKHLIMPSVALSVGNTAVFTRYIRANTIKQLHEEYVITAQSKGASNSYILKKHVLKNCLLPIITLMGMNLASLVTGSFIIESIFGWPGMGTLGMSAINSRDYPMIMGFTMLSCIILILGNLIADILYGFVDPRIKIGEKR